MKNVISTAEMLILMGVFTFGVATFAEELSLGSAITGEEKSLYREEIGESDPLELNAPPYFFIDSEFISPPYEIRRIGQAVTINGRVVNLIYRGRIREDINDEITEKIEDPKMPEVDENSSIFDRGLNIFLRKKFDYLKTKYPEKEARVEIFNIIRALPCVTETQELSDAVRVTHKDGQRGVFFYQPFIPASRNPSYQQLQRTASIIESIMSNRYDDSTVLVIFLFTSGKEVGLPERRTFPMEFVFEAVDMIINSSDNQRNALEFIGEAVNDQQQKKLIYDGFKNTEFIKVLEKEKGNPTTFPMRRQP